MRTTLTLIALLAAAMLPASARVTTAQAMRTCQDQVRSNAADRFGTLDIQIRSTNLVEQPDARDHITGTFTISPRVDQEETHTFACSVNGATGELRWAQIDPQSSANSPAADRSAYTDTDAMNTCRDAVVNRIHDLGYAGVDVGSIRVDNTPGRNDWVLGEAHAGRGDHTARFDFTCRVNRYTGSLKSVDVNGR